MLGHPRRPVVAICIGSLLLVLTALTGDPAVATAPAAADPPRTVRSEAVIDTVTVPRSAVKLYDVPLADSGLQRLVRGGDGNMWFSQSNSRTIGRVTAAGTITEFTLPPDDIPTEGDGPQEMVSAVDGTLWFLTDFGTGVWRMNPSAAAPEQVYEDTLWNLDDLAPSRTGGVWGTMAHGTGYDEDGDGLLRLDPATQTAYRYSATYLHPNPMTLAADGAMWFADSSGYLKRVTDEGAQSNTPVDPGRYDFTSMAFDGAGTLWFTGYSPAVLYVASDGGMVGRLAGGKSQIWDLDPEGTEDPLPRSMQLGPDGAMWFAESHGIGRIDASGHTQVASLSSYDPSQMAFGPDGRLWFVDRGANKVGVVDVAGIFAPTKAARKLSLGFAAATSKFSGKVTSVEPSCRKVRVAIVRKQHGKDPTVGHDKSSARGAFVVKVNAAKLRDGTYYAKAVKTKLADGTICRAARSKSRTVHR